MTHRLSLYLTWSHLPRLISRHSHRTSPQVEHVYVYLDLDHAKRGDLEIVLISPGGSRSVLIPGPCSLWCWHGACADPAPCPWRGPAGCPWRGPALCRVPGAAGAGPAAYRCCLPRPSMHTSLPLSIAHPRPSTRGDRVVALKAISRVWAQSVVVEDDNGE